MRRPAVEKDYGYRRVQRTGRGSYIISLPKEWVEQTSLEKGSEVAVRSQDDLSLTLVPAKLVDSKAKERQEPKEYWIHVGVGDDARTVCRKVIASYVVNADLIHIRLKGSEDAQNIRAAVNSLVRNVLLGSEIVDEAARDVTIQILISHPEFPVEKAIRRMAILALSADKDAVLAISNDDGRLIQEVLALKDDVERLNLYVIRQLKVGLELNLSKELGFKSPKEFLGYRMVANDIKSIADNATNIARNVATLRKMIKDQMLFLGKPVDEELFSQLLDFNTSAHELFEESLKALFKRDYDHADKIISKLETSATVESDLIAIMSSKKLDPNVSSIFSLVLDNSRRIMEYSRNISEVTLNRTIEEVSRQKF